MPKILLLSVLLFFTIQVVKGQDKITIKGDSAVRDAKPDTAKYVNLGKIAARKAVFRSMIIPGWGQAGNGLNFYRGLKIAAIYTGGTMLALSYIDNNNNYHQYLAEVQYRALHGDQPKPGNGLESYSNTAGITTAKEIFRRNREVVVFSFVALYAVNIIEAYVDARLKYFDIGNESALKFSPTMINSNTMYGYHSFAPALKISLKL